MKNIINATLIVFSSMFAITGCVASGLSVDQPEKQSTTQPSLKIHEQGMPSARANLVIYEDLACPFMHTYQPRIDQLMQAHPMDVKITFAHFPLYFEQNAFPAAQAVECASEIGGEGAFWDMHDQILAATPSSYTGEDFDFAGIANSIGIDGAALNVCIQSGKYRALIESAQSAASDHGVNGSPTTLFNGTQLDGAVTYDKLEEAYTAATSQAL
jgi:protein-disulfide isomerase